MTRPSTALAKLEQWRAELDAARKAERTATKRLHEWIVKAVDADVPAAEVARVSGYSSARVSQIAPRAKAAQTRAHAQKNGGVASRVNDAATVPSVAGIDPATGSGVASVRQRRPYGRMTGFVDWSRSAYAREDWYTAHEPSYLAATLETVASWARENGVARVFLTGALPMVPDGATKAERVRSWVLHGLSEGSGWRIDSAFLADADLPSVKVRHEDGTRVTVMRAAAWWGETDADVLTCVNAWRGLGAALDQERAFAGGGIADTPATAGRALWLRTIPEGKSYPVLSDELRELLHATAGQGRVQLLPPATRTADDFTVLDGRMMYAGLTWGMPVGTPEVWTSAQIEAWSAREFTSRVRGRSRWRITCRVPDGWEHLGMFAVPGDERWLYPDQPGQMFTTWADGSEVWAAMEYGWDQHLVIHEGITWAEGKPLDTWRDALVRVWTKANAAGDQEAGRLAARAVRSMILYTIGAFASQLRPVTRTASVNEPDRVPEGVAVRVVGDTLVWDEPSTMSEWTRQTLHPEWSATVWARARTRLLTATGAGGQRVGALHLPREQIVGLATDALYLAGDPGWSDDGVVGRFRVKGTRPGTFTWPTSASELYRLRDEAGDL